MEEEQIVYFLKVFPDPTGNYEIKGEKYRLDLQTNPRFWIPSEGEKVTRNLVKQFSHLVRLTTREGRPKRTWQFILTAEEISREVSCKIDRNDFNRLPYL